MEQSTVFAGLNGYVWWIGVVEDRKDPLNLCRCRIRIFGWHTDDKVMIPTDGLPWAQPILPINGSKEFSTPKEGEWVTGFFLDGQSGQFPIYNGVIPGIPSPYVNNPKVGFNDPRTDAELAAAPIPYGQSAKRHPRYPDEPSTSRLYRNENLDTTVIGRRNSSLTTGIPTADGSSWDEPKSAYAAVPPYNNAKETESGHALEFDDTPNAERINLAHRTGTYIEMRPDGSQAARVVGSNYEIIAGSDYVNIKGSCNITINGNANIKVGGNANLNVSGNLDETISGNHTIKVSGNYKLTASRIDLN